MISVLRQRIYCDGVAFAGCDEYLDVATARTVSDITRAALTAGWTVPVPSGDHLCPTHRREVCPHSGWSLDGNKRTCDECGTRLPDDPDRQPRRINPTFWT